MLCALTDPLPVELMQVQAAGMRLEYSMHAALACSRYCPHRQLAEPQRLVHAP